MSNELLKLTAVRVDGETPLFSSLELANLIRVRHNDFKRGVERAIARGELNIPAAQECQKISLVPTARVKVQRERREETVEIYLLTIRQCAFLTAKLNAKFLEAVLEKAERLATENLNLQIISNNLKIRHLQVLNGEHERHVALLESSKQQLQHAHDAAVEHAHKLEGQPNSTRITELAKQAYMKRRDTIKKLIEFNFAQRVGNKIVPTYYAHAHGYTANTLDEDFTDENGVTYPSQVKFTAKGVSAFLRRIEAEKNPAEKVLQLPTPAN